MQHADEQAEQLRRAEELTTQLRERLARYVSSLHRTGMGNREPVLSSDLMESEELQQLGWFHPLWAPADGSQPEPWHWEFAG